MLGSKIIKNLLFIFIACLVIGQLPGCVHPVKAAQKLDKHAAKQILYRLQAATEKTTLSGLYAIEEKFTGVNKNVRWQIHVWPDNRAVYKLLPQKDDSTAQMLIRDGDSLYFSSSESGNKWIMWRKLHARYRKQRFFIDIDLLCENYQIELDSGPSFLGKSTKSIIISSLWAKRPSVAILFDAGSDLILRTEIKVPADSGAVFSRQQYWESIDYGVPDPALFLQAKKGTALLKMHNPESMQFHDLTGFLSEFKDNFLLPEKVPAGFKLHLIRKLQHHKHEILHFLYTDGLSTISLFEEPGGKLRKRGKKPSWSHLRLLRGQMHGVSYRLMGELPQSELKEIAANLFAVKRQNNLSYFAWGIGIAGPLLAMTGIWLAFFRRYRY